MRESWKKSSPKFCIPIAFPFQDVLSLALSPVLRVQITDFTETISFRKSHPSRIPCGLMLREVSDIDIIPPQAE